MGSVIRVNRFILVWAWIDLGVLVGGILLVFFKC